ncbi:MAG TPA: cobalamin biosynthesis protein CbiG [Alphaproteobacteria bacterium]|nr:cobalamin biosynthesis protein CbiG [Alphaproteobacteria bacterium]
MFNLCIVLDWSAAAVPRQGPDSIWFAALAADGTRLAWENPPTRGAAIERLAALIGGHPAARVLLGCDFPFGYPAGTAAALGLEGAPWRAMWRLLSSLVRDDDATNANNRFAVAADLNRRLSGGAFPFWGGPPAALGPFLGPRRPRPHGPGEPAARRLCELRVPRTQGLWKLYTTGSVGGQALTGIPRIAALRERLAGRATVWPFETGLAAPDLPPGRVVLAPVYPSLIDDRAVEHPVKDARQVLALAERLRAAGASGELARWLAGPSDLTPAERAAVEGEEGWILGVMEV